MDRMAARSRNIGASVAALLAVLAVGAVGLPAPGAAKHEAVAPVRPSLERSTVIGSLTVMSYNVEGLPPPARFGRSASLERIGAGLAALRREPNQPNQLCPRRKHPQRHGARWWLHLTRRFRP